MTFILAIDGPAGAGKSTVARQVALRLNLTYIDTGAMYRSVALNALQNRIALEDTAALISLSNATRIHLEPLSKMGTQTVYLNGADVSQAIRTPEVSQATSRISAIPEIRRIVVAEQRRMGEESERGVVLEGRDIGTVVFPHANLKIFLTASPVERAKRRHEELLAKGTEIDFETVLRDQEERDDRDTHRTVAPLIAAEDAVSLSTDGLSISQVVDIIIQHCQERGVPPPSPVETP
jgi:cytidylate kinase